MANSSLIKYATLSNPEPRTEIVFTFKLSKVCSNKYFVALRFVKLLLNIKLYNGTIPHNIKA